MAAAVLTSALTGAALNLIASLQGIAGYPIVVLERGGDDPSLFWNRSAQLLCHATGENWCGSPDLVGWTDTTNPLGWSKLITYVGRTSGQTKKVCAVLPPAPDVSPSMAATGLSEGNIFGPESLPTSADTYIWLLLQAAANCIQDADPAFAERRADAFSSLGTTMIDGDPISTQPGGVGPARYFQNFRHHDVNRWSVNVGERYQFDMWKAQAAAVAPQKVACSLAVVANTGIDTDTAARDPALQQQDACTGFGGGSTASGNITDANLYIWLYQAPIGAPPAEWVPYAGFSDWNAAAQWTFDTASSLAKQYSN